MKLGLFARVMLVLATAANVEAQEMSAEVADNFVSDLLNTPGGVSKWVVDDELEASRRLGISYDGVLNKFLVSYDIDEETRDRVKNGTARVHRTLKNLDAGFSLLSLTFEPGGDDVEYYFRDDRLVSPIYYHSRDWRRFETNFFVFFLSDKSLFNNYGAEKLDAFVADVLDVIGVSETRRNKLKEAKIYYYLCGSSEEIRDLTSYNTRGMYNLAYDYIVSTYNCHYHEIVHLLVNFKLEKVSLYTHPFFQEGIAVALGGRGGKEPSIIRDVGMFLEQSQIAKYQDLLSYESFVATDPSLSYPTSGLYNAFLIDALGADKYLELYREYSGEKARVEVLESDLPTTDLWKSYLRTCAAAPTIVSGERDGDDCDPIYSDAQAKICEDTTRVYFEIGASVLLSGAETPAEFVSVVFKNHYPTHSYEGEKYLITADKNEISVYNLYTNNLVAKYVPAMLVQGSPIVVEDGLFYFSVDASVFDEALRATNIKILPTGQ
ncbi:MAG: hypothetical protein JSW58_05010 [Candidatus Latescibacterota bacterium]|nr:MAG: hypothetical protein JSW58_05010 [Candidatus Latescibacterota bacterium]